MNYFSASLRVILTGPRGCHKSPGLYAASVFGFYCVVSDLRNDLVPKEF